METEIFTICDHTQDAAGKLFIIGTFDCIRSPQFPLLHSFMLAGRVRFSESEAGEKRLKVKMIDSKGNEIAKAIEGVFPVGKPAPQTEFTGINLALNYNQIVFERPGTYSFELYINDEWVSGTKVFAMQP